MSVRVRTKIVGKINDCVGPKDTLILLAVLYML